MKAPVFRSILCPVDFLDPSIEALRFAIALAGHDQAQLTLLNVNECGPTSPAKPTRGASSFVREAEQALAGLLLRVMPGTADWAPVPHITVRTGRTDREILACAVEEHCDLIVMGTEGMDCDRSKFYGSPTERVLRHSSVPVLSVPPLPSNVLLFTDRAPVFGLGFVLAAIDFGPSTYRCTQIATQLAEKFDTSLLLVHVVRMVEAPSVLRLVFRNRERGRVHERGEQLARLAKSTCRAAVETYVTAGRPADEIVEIAARHGTGLIVIGATGEGACESQPGSVACRVLTLTPVPVVALPPMPRETAVQGMHRSLPSGLSR